MMNRKNSLSLALLAAVLASAGCAKTYDSSLAKNGFTNSAKEGDPVVNGKVLGTSNSLTKGEPIEDVMKRKYRVAEVVCELRLQSGTEVSHDVAPVERYTWNLLTELDNMKTFSLRGKIPEQVLEVLISASSIDLRDTVMTDEKMNTVTMVNSPVIAVDFAYNGGIIALEKTTVNNAKPDGHAELHEGVKTVLVDNVLDVLNSDPAVKHLSSVECVIHTEAHPEFANEYTVESSKR